MTAFATIDDLELFWRPLTDPETSRATALLDYAATIITARVADVSAAGDTVLQLVSVSMVKRAMIGTDLDGVSTDQHTAGPFSTSRSYTNPMGNLYLSADDLRLLRVGVARPFTIDTTPAATQ
ncbi:Gp19/Gp15/Gp42 family protein [Rhodococcus jostii]|uniref:Gp19/Gp15/Gp42 family protein n=1 Tax=Rhodococcus jostii TaxID=132919 RepID=UPI003645A51A